MDGARRLTRLTGVIGTDGALSAQALARLDAFRAAWGRAGAVLLSGIPVPDDLPPTPIVPFERCGLGEIGTECLLRQAGERLGELIGFEDWHQGATVQNLYPIEALSRRQCASNTVFLEYHTETAFRPATPDALVLLCLRAPEDRPAETFLIDFDAVTTALSPSERAMLGEPRFGFVGEAADETARPREPLYPILQNVGRSALRVHYAEAIRGADPEAHTLVLRLRALVYEGAQAVRLQKGDALIIDNWHMVHGRSTVAAAYDGRDRWLQRVLVRAIQAS